MRTQLLKIGQAFALLLYYFPLFTESSQSYSLWSYLNWSNLLRSWKVELKMLWIRSLYSSLTLSRTSLSCVKLISLISTTFALSAVISVKRQKKNIVTSRLIIFYRLSYWSPSKFNQWIFRLTKHLTRQYCGELELHLTRLIHGLTGALSLNLSCLLYITSWRINHDSYSIQLKNTHLHGIQNTQSPCSPQNSIFSHHVACLKHGHIKIFYHFLASLRFSQVYYSSGYTK